MLSIFKKLLFKDYVIILLVLLTAGFFIGYRHYYLKSKTPVVVYNTDSLEIYKNKIKTEYVSKTVYVQDIENIKKQNTLISEELKNLKDNPLVITNTLVKVKTDTVYAESEKIIKEVTDNRDTTYNLGWRFCEPNNYYSISGNTFVKQDFSEFSTRINSIGVDTRITLDLIEEKNNIKIIGKTDNPFVNITNMEGAVINPNDSKLLKKYVKQKKFSIGPSLGFGMTSDGKIGASVGVGITYGILQF